MKHSLLIAIFGATTLFVSCSKKDVQDLNSPAALIAKSNTMVIPQLIRGSYPTDSFAFALVAKGYKKFKVGLAEMVYPYWKDVGISTSTKLFDKNNQPVGIMNSELTWIYAPNNNFNNASQMVGLTDAIMPAPTGFNDLAWIRFSKQPAAEEEDPKSPFIAVTHVQRVLTSGGIQYALPTPQANNVGNIDSVAFTAVYRFFVKKSS